LLQPVAVCTFSDYICKFEPITTTATVHINIHDIILWLQQAAFQQVSVWWRDYPISVTTVTTAACICLTMRWRIITTTTTDAQLRTARVCQMLLGVTFVAWAILFVPGLPNCITASTPVPDRQTESRASPAVEHWGTCPRDFQQNFFFSLFRSHTKSITAISIWSTIFYRFENV